MFLDIWEQAKTAEETFVRSVEQNDYIPLKACGVDHLLKIDVSDETRRRVKEALLPHVEAALSRTRDPPTTRDMRGANEPIRRGDSTLVCALYGFWLEHSKEGAPCRERSRLFLRGDR